MMKLKHITLVFNPTAGYGRKKMLFKSKKSHKNHYEITLNKIKTIFESHKINVSVIIIDKTINITQLVANLSLDKTDLVIAAGGDGTINSVINGLMISNIPLGIIPIGSVNILALDLGISSDIQQACLQIINGQMKKIDIGKVNETYFSSMAGIGFDAKVIKHTPIKLKKKHGLLSFAFIAFKLITTYKFRPIHLFFDDNNNIKTAYFVIINNAKYYGGKFIVSPLSSLTDGKLDITLLKKGSILSLLSFAKHLIYGTLDQCSQTEFIQATKLSLKENEKHHTHVDAEYIGKKHITISIKAMGLSIIY